MPYFVVVKSKLEYSSVAWNSVMIADSSKLEHIKVKFSPLQALEALRVVRG
jgi:hypothetical protein